MPNAVMRSIVRWFAGALRGIRDAWDDSLTAHEILVEVNTPWRQDGVLRWCKGPRGWELHGNRLAD